MADIFASSAQFYKSPKYLRKAAVEIQELLVLVLSFEIAVFTCNANTHISDKISSQFITVGLWCNVPFNRSSLPAQV